MTLEQGEREKEKGESEQNGTNAGMRKAEREREEIEKRGTREKLERAERKTGRGTGNR